MRLTDRGWKVVGILVVLTIISTHLILNHLIPWDAVWVKTK